MVFATTPSVKETNAVFASHAGVAAVIVNGVATLGAVPTLILLDDVVVHAPVKVDVAVMV